MSGVLCAPARFGVVFGVCLLAECRAVGVSPPEEEAQAGRDGEAADGPLTSPSTADASGSSLELDAADGGDAQGGENVVDASRDSGPASLIGHKRGVAYGANSDADLAALAQGITWWYNWSPSPESTLSAGYFNQVGVEFVPMIWNGDFNVGALATLVPASAKFLLTFNEPNSGTQANMTPQQAAAAWPQVQSFAQSRGLKIVSPAVNYCGGNCNEGSPFVWLSDFFSACQGCEVDYVAVHWYACTRTALTSFVQTFETMFDKPIWSTEFSCADGSLPATVANEESYMQQAVAALEADPMVFRYAWFTGRDSSLTAIDLLGADSGDLTALGQEYVEAPPTK